MRAGRAGAALRPIIAVARRELRALVATPVAAVFVAAFVTASALMAFELGGLFEAGRAELDALVQFHPWLLAVFAPALAMRSWAEERREGTLETLLALPVPVWGLVAGKFLALWLVAGAALAGTAPVWIGIALLGPVDHGATATAYLGSLLAAAALLATGMLASAVSSSQVTAFVLGVLACVGLVAAGVPAVGDGLAALLTAGFGSDAGQAARGALAALSVLDQTGGFQRGVIEAPAVVFFAGLTALMLALTALALDLRRARGLTGGAP
jgi:ABC-2 type transport system permease protein